MSAKKTIVLIGSGNQRHDERLSVTSGIVPGMLLEITSANKVQVHSTAADVAVMPLYAIENTTLGKGIDDAYASGDTVYFVAPSKGDKINALMGTGINAAVGAEMESAGNGTVRLRTTGQLLGIADEAVNNASGSNARLAITIA